MKQTNKKDIYVAPAIIDKAIIVSCGLLFGSDTQSKKTNVDTEDLTEEDWSSDFGSSSARFFSSSFED